MSSITTPDLLTGDSPVNISNLDRIFGTDPKVFSVVKTGDYLDGGPAPPYRYFGTGDIAKLQSAVLLSDTSGSWNNPDIIAGGIEPNPEFLSFMAQFDSCICSKGGTIMGMPANIFFQPHFLDDGPVMTLMGPTMCFKDEDSVAFAITSPKSDQGLGVTRTRMLPSTYLFTEEQAIIPGINEMIGETGLSEGGYANFSYTKRKIDETVATFEKHLGPIYTSTDYARIKTKIGLAPTIEKAYFEGNLYSGLEVNYDAHTNFVYGFHAISGNIVYTTGNQYITGHKIFDDKVTTISGTGYIDTVIGGVNNSLHPQDRYSSILGGSSNAAVGHYSTIIGGDNQSISNEVSSLRPNLLGVGVSNLINDDNSTTEYNTILNGRDNEITNSKYSFIDGGRGAHISGGFSNVIIGSSDSFSDARIEGAENSQISSSVGVNINNSGVQTLDGVKSLNQLAIAIGVQASEINNEGKSEANVLLGTSLGIMSGWNHNSAILGGYNNKILTWSGLDNAIVNGLNNLISGDTRKGAPVSPYNCLTAGGYSQVLGHKGAFVLSDSLNLPDKYSIDDDTISLYFSQGVYASGDLYQYQDGSYSRVLTEKSLETGFGNFNISGDLRVTGNSYLSGDLWILGADGKPCKVACSGDASTFNQHTTFNSGVTVNSGDLTITSGNLNMSGNLNVTGNAYISGQLWILGSDGAPCRVACSGEGSPLTTKGDIWGYDTDNARVPVGSDTQVLVADANRAPGVKWTSPCLALTGCHQFGIGDPISDALLGLKKSRIAQYDHAGALTESDGTSLGCYGFASQDGLISGANAGYQIYNLLFGGVSNSITGYIGQSNMLAGGALNTLVNAESASQANCPSYSTIAGGIQNSITGFGLHAGLLLGGRGNKILAKTTLSNTNRDGGGASGPNYMAGFNQILGGSNNLITQTLPGGSWPSNPSARGTYGNTIIGGISARIENQSESVLIQAGGMPIQPNYAHTGDGTSTFRGKTITLTAYNGIFASGKLYVTGDNGTWIRITGGAGGGGGLTSPLTTKGDLWGYDTDNARLPVGSDGQVLISDATAPLGVKWSDSGAGSIFNSGITVNSGDLTITSGNLNMSGDLNVTGNSYLSGELWILGLDGKPCKVACSGDAGGANIVYTTGDQYITGHKIFDDNLTTISGTGYIDTIIGGTNNSLHPQSRRSSILGGHENSTVGHYSVIIGGYNQHISQSTFDALRPNLLGVGVSNLITDDNSTSEYNTILNGINNEILNSKYSFIDGGQGVYLSGGWNNVIIGSSNPVADPFMADAQNSLISSSTSISINNIGVQTLDGVKSLNKRAIAIGVEASEINNEGQSEANVLLGTTSGIMSGWNYNSAILGGYDNKILTWSGKNNAVVNGLGNLISGDTRKGAPVSPYNCLTAGGYSQVLGHKGAFVLSDSQNLPDKYSIGDDTISLYFSQGVYASGNLYQYQDGSYSRVLTEKSLETGFGNFNISGDLRVTGNSYLSGDLWILGADGKPCKVACSGDSSTNTFDNYVTFNSGISVATDSVISGKLSLHGDLGVSGCIKSYQCVTDSSAASYTLSMSDFGKIIHYNPASDAVISLPGVSSMFGLADGWQTTVMNISSNKITLNPMGALVLKSDGTIIAGQYQAATIYYKGGDWYAAGALSS